MICERIKMLLLFTSLLITFAGTIQASEDCEEGPYSACDVRGPGGFPGNEEELDKLCHDLISELECLTKFQEKCSIDFHQRGVEKAALAVLQDMCNKSNILNAVVVENLQCYKDIFEDDETSRFCSREFPETEKRQQYNQAVIQEGIDSFEGNETVRCVFTVYSASCYALQIKECGKTALEAYIKITHNFVRNAAICGDETAEFLPQIIKVIIQEDQLAEEVGEALKKKK